jgi:hypothetical protein
MPRATCAASVRMHTHTSTGFVAIVMLIVFVCMNIMLNLQPCTNRCASSTVSLLQVFAVVVLVLFVHVLILPNLMCSI